MSLAGGWILFPLVLAVAVVGVGLLAERAARVTLPGALLPAVGLAGVIVLAGPFVLLDATAELATPVVAVAALAGLALARPWRDPRLRAAGARPALACALAAFALLAAPPLLTGQGSIAGYVKLDDSATWLGLTDHVMQHGRSREGVPPSTYLRELDAWLGSGYPVGSFLPLGVGAKLSGQDVANGYQPAIALLAALLALGIAACARPFAGGPWRAAAAGVLGVQASLYAGYLLWGGIKEAVAAALLPPLALLAVRAWARDDGLRALALLCVVAGGALGALGVNGAAWAAPALLAGALGAARARRTEPRVLARWGVGLAALAAAAALPALATLDFLRNTTQGAISAGDDLGNLAKPLPLLEGAGLWPVGDFRFDPDPRGLAALLALAGLIAAVWAVGLAIQRGAWPLPALVLVTAAGTIAAVAIGSPWVDAKALALSAPVLLGAAAALALAGLTRSDAARIAAVAGLAVLVAGCAWSTVAVARDVQIAPRERLAELRDLAKRIDGQGPTVVLDFEIYAQRHFLRDAQSEGATDLRVRPVARRDGQLFPALSTAEVDEIATPDLWIYRTIVRRRSPAASRPPKGYERIWARDGFEAWQRAPDAPAPLARLPLGDTVDPTAVPDCARVRALARTPGARALAYVERRPPVVAGLDGARMPAAWLVPTPGSPHTKGTATLALPVAQPGEWQVYVGGVTFGRLTVRVDGRDLGSRRHELSHGGQYLRFGATRLTAGAHRVELDYAPGLLRAGTGAGDQPPLGPVTLSPAAAERAQLPVREVPVRQARRLCDGRTFDWIEAIG